MNVSGIDGYLGVHAAVHQDYRGLTVISNLMKKMDEICFKNQVKFVCGFANNDFAKIKQTLFKWKIPFWIAFNDRFSPEDYNLGLNKKYKFNYPDEWFIWRFGENINVYKIQFTENEHSRIQLLKLKKHENLSDNEIENWSCSSLHPSNSNNEFRQPFSIKVYDNSLIREGFLNYQNWFIEMGDSDTFMYNKYS